MRDRVGERSRVLSVVADVDRSTAPTVPVNTSFLFGAHHPHCGRHDAHLLWIGGRPVCLGCTCFTAGAVVGALLAIQADWAGVTLPAWVAGHLLLLVPTALQPWIQWKPFKVAGRSLLGLTAATYLLSGLWFYSPDAHVGALRLLTPVAFAAGIWLLRSLRELKPSDPCRDCPLGVFPHCSWNEFERQAS